MEPVLEVRNLTKIFREEGKEDFTAVDNVSFSLYPGETLGIVGESGSGKSTIAKCMMCLTDVTEGSILLDGREIAGFSAKPGAPGKVPGRHTGMKERRGRRTDSRKQTARWKEQRDLYRKIQMVFQSPTGSFDPRRTLGYSIAESLKNNRVSKTEIHRKVDDLMRLCGLDAELANRYPHQVSGGQCQRAAIARALAISPKILIFDEATSALDVTVQQEMMEFLVQLKEEYQLSYLFICHNLALVQNFCDRVLVMKDGKLVEEGTAHEVILSPKQAYTKLLVESCL